MKTERSYMHAPLRKRTVAMSDSVQLLLSAATDFQERLQFRKQSSPALIARCFETLSAAGRRRGFKCVFERGQLQLHFNLKRFFYRR